MTMEPMTARIKNSLEQLEDIDVEDIDGPERILRVVDEYIPTRVLDAYRKAGGRQ